MKVRQLRDAKAGFNEPVKRAAAEGSQESFVDFMRRSLLVRVKIGLMRDRSKTRNVENIA